MSSISIDSIIALFSSERFQDALDAIEEMILDNPNDAPLSATALAGDLEILVPMAGIIDVDAELKRLTKEIEKLSGEVKKLSGKLSNEKFVANAPAEVVAKERDKLAEMQGSVEQLTTKQSAIAEMA